MKPGPPVVPGTRQAADRVTALLPRVEQARRSGLVRARMTDMEGAELYTGWIPGGARVVTRGARVFMHLEKDEWRQIRVVQLGEDGCPI